MTRRFIHLLLPVLLLIGLRVPSAVGQEAPTPSLTSQDQPVRIAVEPVFQRYVDGDRTLQETSIRLSSTVPVTSRLQVRASGVVADAQAEVADRTTGIRGPGDVSVGAVYAQPTGDGSLVFTLDATLPTGKKELTADELRTTILLSQDLYRFRVPSFGQGVTVMPSASYAFPVGDDVMLGFGAAYHYLGGYRPVADMTDTYEPGNRMEVFGGVDVRVGEQTALSADLSYSRYGTDQVGGTDRYAPGNRFALTAQYLYRSGFTTVRALARVQRWGKSTLEALADPDGPRPNLAPQRVVPSEAAVQVQVGARVTERLRMTGRVSGRAVEETILFEAGVMGAVDVAPRVQIGEFVYVSPRGSLIVGDVNGLEAGIRTEVRF